MTSRGNFLANLECYYSFTPMKNLETEFEQIKIRLELSENNLITLFKKMLLLPGGSESKVKERILSRLALAHLLSILPEELEKLQFDEQFQLKKLPHIRCSLSHSAQGVACVKSAKEDFLGIDVETSTRKIDPYALKYFSHPKDLPETNLLELWVKKEAAFKAIHHYQHHYQLTPKVLGLSEICVQKDIFTFKENAIQGELQFMELPEHQSLMAIARIKKK